jgi:hypothetical protein
MITRLLMEVLPKRSFTGYGEFDMSLTLDTIDY